MNGRTTLVQAGTLVLAALLLLSLGALTGMVLTGAGTPPERGRIAEERSKDYDLTNPLLDCEGAGDAIEGLALRPFKDKVAAVVDRLIRGGLVRQVSVYFRDLNNGPWYGINENVAFAPSGLLKIPLAMAVMKEAESDPSVLKQVVKHSPRQHRSAPANFVPAEPLAPGRAYTTEELLEIMLTRSDADAAALLAERVDPLVAAGVFADLDVPAPPEAVRDHLSVRALSRFFRVLFNASYLTKRSSEHLLSLLSRSSFRSGIAAGVPDDIAVASKYGEQALGPEQEIKELHDCGIVYYPNSPYLLCVMTMGDRFEGNAAAIREVSMFVYTTVDAHHAGRSGGRERGSWGD